MTTLPLSGIRVLDFTVVWAGPYATMLLADFGAEVIRVESLQHFPPTTRGQMPRPPASFMQNASRLQAGYPDWEPGEHPWNRHPMFNCHARNKLSMTVDTTRSEGQAIVRRLVEISDVVVENNPVTTMPKLGLDYDTVRGWKDDIIYVSMPPFGHTGAYRTFRGYGNNVEALSGLATLRGYADLGVRSNPRVLYMDAASGPGAAFAVLCALHHRERTGEGQFVDFAQAENMMPHVGEFFLAAAMNGRDADPIGNHHPAMAPHNCYPCQGDDRWLVIAVATDTEWRALCQALGEPDWAMQDKFATLAGRLQRQDELDRYLTLWTRQQEPRAAIQHLQAYGVAAGMVMFEDDAYADPHLKARGFFVSQTHPECGTHRYPGMLWQMSKTLGTIRRPACCLGEHNDYVYRQLLGMSAMEIERLRQAGHIGNAYIGV